MAVKFQSGRAVSVNTEANNATSTAATIVYKAAGDIGSSTQRLKRFVPDNPELAALVSEGDALRAQAMALYKKLVAASK